MSSIEDTGMTTTVDTNDVQLLQDLANKKDRGAWEHLVDRHGAVMYRAVLGATGDPGLAEDAVQEALLHVRDRADRFRAPLTGDPAAAVRGWLVRIAVNAAFQLARGNTRRRTRERKVAETQMNTEHPAPGTIPTDPVAIVIQNEESGLLRRALAALPERHRQPILLHYYAGMNHNDMAATMDCKPGTARIRLHRALKGLRSKLKRLGLATSLLVMTGWLEATAAEAATATVPTATTASWIALIYSPLVPNISTASLTGGMTMMTKITLSSIAAVAVLSLGIGIARLPAAQEDPPTQQGQPTTTESTAPAENTATIPPINPGLQAVAKAYAALYDECCKTEAYAAARRVYHEKAGLFNAALQEALAKDPTYQEALLDWRNARTKRQGGQQPTSPDAYARFAAAQQAVVDADENLVALKAAVDAASAEGLKVLDAWFAADPTRQAVKEKFEKLRESNGRADTP